jgi:hypothetical protein
MRRFAAVVAADLLVAAPSLPYNTPDFPRDVLVIQDL